MINLFEYSLPVLKELYATIGFLIKYREPITKDTQCESSPAFVNMCPSVFNSFPSEPDTLGHSVDDISGIKSAEDYERTYPFIPLPPIPSEPKKSKKLPEFPTTPVTTTQLIDYMVKVTKNKKITQSELIEIVKNHGLQEIKDISTADPEVLPKIWHSIENLVLEKS